MSGLKSAGLAFAVVAWSGAPALGQPQAEKGARERIIELAHQVTAAAAIDTLPKQLKGFYKAHRAEMPSLALEPEFAPRGPERRFLVDRLSQFPFDDLPHTEASLNAKYGDKAQGVGRLPWLVQESYARLVDAMKAPTRRRSSPSRTCSPA